MAERLPEGPVTIVFSDVVGSTDLRTEHGDTAAHRLLRKHEEVVRRCVAAHDGREVKALGDGFMLAFSSVRRALDCAVAIQQALAERNAETPGEEVHVRIGVNTGEVVVENGDLYGQAVNAAARIAAVADGGEVLVSDIVRQLAGAASGFTFVDRGEFGLKGFPDPWRLHAIAHEVTRPAAVLGARTPFVGRRAERVELRKVLGQVQAGIGAFVMIGGEPGVGKTRLAEELTRRCEREGFLTYTGHCYEAAGAAPYIPIVETFEQALARAPSPQAFRKFLGDAAPDVARLVPRLRNLCPDIPPPLELPAEQERRYLFNSLWDVLARTARVKPTLFVLDDIHWADEPTMLLIQHIAERLADVPLLMVGLYRDSELDIGRPLSRVFGELTRRRLAVRLPLRRLPTEAIAEMLTGLAGQAPPPELVDLIYAETEGNPFFTEEVFKHLAEEGRLFDDQGRFRGDLTAEQLDVPEGVRLVVGARLRRLRDEGSKMLGSAAILGRVFTFELLRQFQEMPEEPLLDLIEEAQRAGLVVALPDQGMDERFMFAHELIRQTVLGDLSLPRRRRLHARAADVLERAHAAGLAPHAAAIVHHLIEAGAAADPKRVFRYLMMAGEWAQETAAFEQALSYLERAADRIDAATPGERAELLWRLGTARRAIGRWDQAIHTWMAAVDGFEALGDVQRAAAACDEAAYTLAWATRWEEGVALAQRGLELLGDEVSVVRARLLAQKGMVIAWAEGVPPEAGDEMLTEALRIADQLDDSALRGSCLLAVCLNRKAWFRQAECVEAGLEAADLLRQRGAHWEEAAVLGFVTQALAGLGRFPEAVRWAAHLETLAERIGNIPALLQARRVLHGMTGFARTGDPVALEAFGRADLKLAGEHGLPWVSNSHAWIGIAHFLRGDWESARGFLETAATIEPPGGAMGWDRAHLFEFLAYSGERDAALAMLADPGDNRLPVSGRHNQWGRWMMLLSAVEGLYVLDERTRAAELFDLVVQCIALTGGVCGNYHDMRLVHRAAGIAATAAGRFDDAEAHFRTALRQAEELPHLPEQAHTRRFYAAMLLERGATGDREKAAGHAAEAAELYRRMGMPRHLAMVEALPI